MSTRPDSRLRSVLLLCWRDTGHPQGGGSEAYLQRIGACLAEFNRRWSRRLLGQNAAVLLISDGLDADAGEGLDFEAERLAKSCARLIWLNPLLRYEGFEARPAGIRAILPYVDEFLPVHNVASLRGISEALDPARIRSAHRPLGALGHRVASG